MELLLALETRHFDPHLKEIMAAQRLPELLGKDQQEEVVVQER
jgi:hypothetical protein